MRGSLVFVILIFSFLSINGQSELLQSGPMVGYSEMREAAVWIQLKAEGNVQMAYWPIDEASNIRLTKLHKVYESDAYTALLIADQVEPGKRYHYTIFVNGHRVDLPWELAFQTQMLWQWRTDPPDFSFVSGSCFYVNEDGYERPGRSYGGAYEILKNIHERKPDFMLWLGDNVYLREVDWFSRSGYTKRYTHTRSLPELQPLLGNTHHYAIWDDHDYGSNDSDRNWRMKETSADVFNLFWPNPPFENKMGGGITNYFQWADCDFFLLDDRYYKSPNSTPGTVLGREQLEWVKTMLAESQASYKFVCVGVMFLSSAPNKENFIKAAYSEREELIRFIRERNIEGVVFLTGDRHFAELSLLKSKNQVSIYDLTSSALTAGSAASKYRDEINELRVPGTVYYDRNFASISLSGKKDNRVLKLALMDSAGNVIWEKQLDKSSFKP
jgi:alkaline phosphatase D